MSHEDLTITPDDVRDLNRAAVERAAWICRTGGALLVVVGVVGTLGWCWYAVRSQQRVGGFAIFSGEAGDGPQPSLANRIDVAVSSLNFLVSTVLTVGVGLAMRLGANFAQARVGGSVTGYEVGDTVPGDDAEPGADSDERA